VYKIANRTKKIAKYYGYEVKPSNVGFKKIAVFKDGKKIADVGDRRYNDFHTYSKIDKNLAIQKQRQYIARHKNDIKTGRGRLAFLLLWQ
jgi:hypothetical protein